MAIILRIPHEKGSAMKFEESSNKIGNRVTGLSSESHFLEIGRKLFMIFLVYFMIQVCYRC